MSNIQSNAYSSTAISQPSTSKTASFTTNWQGAFWKIFSYMVFAVINGIVRYWSGGTKDPSISTLSVYELLFFQNLFAFFFLLPWLLNGRVKMTNILTKNPTINLLRIATAISGLGLWYLSLRYMPIAESVAITFTGPIFAVIGAKIMLNEKIGNQRWIAIILSLFGSFLIIRPYEAIFNPNYTFGIYALLPLASAILLAFDKIFTRKISFIGASAETLVISFLIFMIPCSSILAYFNWTTPEPFHWPWLISLGLLTAALHYSFVRAYLLAEVSFLTPIGFTKFFFSAFVGYLCFSEIPKHWGFWAGTLVIFLSILLLVELPVSLVQRFRLRTSKI